MPFGMVVATSKARPSAECSLRSGFLGSDRRGDQIYSHLVGGVPGARAGEFAGLAKRAVASGGVGKSGPAKRPGGLLSSEFVYKRLQIVGAGDLQAGQR